MSERYSRYSCSQGQCCRTFTDKYTFGRHIEKCHKDDIVDSPIPTTSSASVVNDVEEVMDSNSGVLLVKRSKFIQNLTCVRGLQFSYWKLKAN